MSTFTLKNEFLAVTTDTAGGELVSVKDTAGTEYIWNADPAWWKRHSPVLFPIVGSLKNKEFRYNGKSYTMGQHGFARDMEFVRLSESVDEVWYLLRADESTKEKYPFDFQLEIGYRLEGHTVSVIWKVTNQGAGVMPFSIGAHPAFYCPLRAGEARDGYEFRFDNSKALTYYAVAEGGLADTRQAITLPGTESGRLAIGPHLFDHDALILEGNQAHLVELARKGEEAFVSVRFDAPLFGLWAPAGEDVPFVCIEPWYGRCDALDFCGELAERAYGQKAEEGETVCYSYAVEFGGGR